MHFLINMCNLHQNAQPAPNNTDKIENKRNIHSGEVRVFLRAKHDVTHPAVRV